MSREVAFTLIFTGALLVIGGLLILALPGVNVVPWVVAMCATGLGLLAGGGNALGSAKG